MDFAVLKGFLNKWHSKNKVNLQGILSYGDGTSDFQYRDGLHVRFSIPNWKEVERMKLYVQFPVSRLGELNYEMDKVSIALEDYVLRTLGVLVKKQNDELQISNKNVREKGEVILQNCSEVINRRNGMIYLPESKELCFTLQCRIPLINGTYINGKNANRLLKDLVVLINDYIDNFDKDACNEWLFTYDRQQQIRNYITENGLISFIADNSIIPRMDGTTLKLETALPFKSPESMKCSIRFEDGSELIGMGIKKGVTVITGGGYSGKSTLLDGIEAGVYNHIPKDGREYVITNNTAVKVYAEDSRPVNNVDLTPFFEYLPRGVDVHEFRTHHASGSVSQAANIIEAIAGGSKVLLFDEDRSATNFMIRDKNMRQIVKKEPIIPFTERVREIYDDREVSTILVIGASSEYLYYADTVIIMDDYDAKEITNYVKETLSAKEIITYPSAAWTSKRYMKTIETNKEFIYFTSVTTENAKKIVLDEYIADVTLLTALISEQQINSIAYIVERIMERNDEESLDIIEVINNITEKMYSPYVNEMCISFNFKAQRWFEMPRIVEVYSTLNRMRGLNFINI